MERKKLPSELNLEDLLNSLDNKPSKLDPIEYKNDVLSFIAFYKLKKGKQKVLKSLIYKLYSKWSMEPIGKRQFSIELSQYFDTDNINYFLNKKDVDLTQIVYKELKESIRDKTKSPDYTNHFENFLNRYNLKGGNYFLETYILYDLYDQWTYKNKQKNYLGYKQFINFCKLYFPKRRITSSKIIWFGVDKSVLETISLQRIEELRQLRKIKNAQKKEKQQKKQD